MLTRKLFKSRGVHFEQSLMYLSNNSQMNQTKNLEVVNDMNVKLEKLDR